MKRFNEYVEINNNDYYIKGVIEIKSGYMSGKVDDIIIPSMAKINRAFNGDIVYIDKKTQSVINVERQNKNRKIVGVLKITSMTTYGVNKKGSYYYMFIPNDRMKPRFYVPFNLKKKSNKEYKNKSRDVYAVITFNNWKTTSKFPIGSINKIIGTIGEIDVEYEYVLHKYGINYNKNKLKFVNEENKTNEKRTDFRNKNVISIDPIGCTDMDDALHYEETDEHIEIGIHIADVSHYVLPNSPIDLEARKRLSTIYSPNKRIDMLPPTLSTDICSLVPNKERLTASVIIILNKDTYDIEDVKFTKGIIKSKCAYTYDEAQVIIDTELDNDISKLNDISNKLVEKIKLTTGSEVGSHRLVETYMVLVNMLVAKEIYEKVDKSLLRTHFSKKKINMEELDDIGDDNLRHHLYVMSMNAAKYVIMDKKCEEEIKHTGLNIKFYTHFTSPIRRYADILVHRMLFSEEIGEIEDTVNEINRVNRLTRNAQRDFNKLELMKMLEEGEVEADAYITNIYREYITIYLPKFKLGNNFRIYLRKLDDMLEYSWTENSITIVNKQKNKKLTFNLLDKIKVKLVSYLGENNFKNKLKTRIIEPNCSEFII